MGEHWSHHLDLTTKRCSGCKTIKDLIEFSVNAARYDGIANYCRGCRLVQQRRIRERNRQDLIAEFGGKCVRCGFADWRALQFDHVNNDGAADRRGGLNQSALARLVRGEPERFQILCANCNQIKRYEQGEAPGRPDQVAAVLTERTLVPRGPSTPRTSYNPRRTLEAEAKGQALAALVAERRPLRKSLVRLPQGSSWSRFYERCLGCEETERSHASDGCCYKCDKIIKGYNRRVSVFGQARLTDQLGTSTV